MSEHDSEFDEHLDPIDTDPEAGTDHPDEVTDGEAQEGQAVYEAVDDLDDDSNGVDQ